MAEYIYTVKDRETGEVLFLGKMREAAEYVGCSYHHIVTLATQNYEYKTKTKYSMYTVERRIEGKPKQGGARWKDAVCCDCGVLMKNVGITRKRCDECREKHNIIQNREYMREVRGVRTVLTPIINPNSKYCEGCVYFEGGCIRCCNYILIEGKKRPCPPGKDCTVKKTNL